MPQVRELPNIGFKSARWMSLRLGRVRQTWLLRRQTRSSPSTAGFRVSYKKASPPGAPRTLITSRWATSATSAGIRRLAVSTVRCQVLRFVEEVVSTWLDPKTQALTAVIALWKLSRHPTRPWISSTRPLTESDSLSKLISQEQIWVTTSASLELSIKHKCSWMRPFLILIFWKEE